VIAYKSKGKIESQRFSGSIFIDKETDAIVWLKESGQLIIPVLIRPVLFALGLDINSIRYAMELKLRPINEQWYPQYTHWDIIVDIEKKYVFKKNEAAIFTLKQELETIEILTSGVVKIPEAKRFDSNEKMAEQVFPIRGLNW